MANSEQQILAEIGRLGHRLRRILKDAPGSEVVATEPDYLAMVDIFAAEVLSTTTAALFVRDVLPVGLVAVVVEGY